MVRAVGIEIFHVVLLERGFVHRVRRAEPMIERGAGAQIAQLGLHHRAQVARRVMTKVDYFAELAFEKNNHASPDLGCWNCHYASKSFYLVFSRAAIDRDH